MYLLTEKRLFKTGPTRLVILGFKSAMCSDD